MNRVIVIIAVATLLGLALAILLPYGLLHAATIAISDILNWVSYE